MSSIGDTSHVMRAAPGWPRRHLCLYTSYVNMMVCRGCVCNLPGTDIESVYAQEGEEVPREPSSIIDTSDTMKSVLRKFSAFRPRLVEFNSIERKRILTFTMQEFHEIGLQVYIIREDDIHFGLKGTTKLPEVEVVRL
jgi:hypothetical protein